MEGPDPDVTSNDTAQAQVRFHKLFGIPIVGGFLYGMIATVPAWLYFFAGRSGIGVIRSGYLLTLVAIILTTAISTAPAINILLRRWGIVRPWWHSTTSAAGIAIVGFGSIISVVFNTSPYYESVAIDIAVVIGVFATGAAAFYSFIRVVSPPSSSGMAARRQAERTMADPPSTSTEERKKLKATAEIGRQGIAEGFRDYGDRNESSARIFLVVGVFIFGCSVAAALWLVSRTPAESTATAVLVRAAITVPGAIVFGVFVREAGARRRYAAWGGLISIQAEHLGQFTADLPDGIKYEVEAQFAKAVFRGGDVALDSSHTGILFRKNHEEVTKAQTDSPAIQDLASLISSLIRLRESAPTMPISNSG